MYNTAFQLDNFEQENEQEMFLKTLHHDSKGGFVVRLLLGNGKNNNFIKTFANKNIENLYYNSVRSNCYTSINTFRSTKRKADEIYNYSAIYIDLDCHNFKDNNELDKTIARTQKRLENAYKSNILSVPTMVTYTGRGIGIFYVLKHSIANTPSAQKSINYFNKIYGLMLDKYKNILADNDLQVDYSVKDGARVCRMPQTLNRKINRWCRLLHIEYDADDETEPKYYELNELAQENKLFELKKPTEKKKSKIVSMDAFKKPFLARRIEKLEKLQEMRDFECVGNRDLMVFCFYNSAKQIYDLASARQMVAEYNKKFNTPLADNELKNICNGCDRNEAPKTKDYKGYYKLNDEWIVKVLEITQEENKSLNFGVSHKQAIRNATKQKNTLKRAERNEKIAKYIKENENETLKDIASVFGVSISMIYRICKQFSISRYEKTEKADNKQENNNPESKTTNKIEKNIKNQNIQKMPISILYGVSTVFDCVDNIIKFARNTAPGDNLHPKPT